jgi:hypothetical protein
MQVTAAEIRDLLDARISRAREGAPDRARQRAEPADALFEDEPRLKAFVATAVEPRLRAMVFCDFR